MKKAALVACVCIGCGDGASAGGDVGAPSDVGQAAESTTAPAPAGDPLAGAVVGRGQLVAVSPDFPKLGGSWEAKAGTCPGQPVLIIEAEEGGAGAVIVLRLPEEGVVPGTYPVYVPGDSVVPVPGALAAVQLYQTTGSFGFRALSGGVELDEVGDRLSGRLTLNLDEVSVDTSATLFGAFEGIPVGQFDDGTCAPAGADSKTVGGERTAGTPAAG